MEEIENLMQQAETVAASGATARQAGEENAAEGYYRRALVLTVEAAGRISEADADQVRQKIISQSVRFALECGEAAEARRLMATMEEEHDHSLLDQEDWRQFRDVNAWTDVWLVAAVRRDPPDAVALDTLVERYWKPLFGRCQLLTVNHHKASDLAQETWCRILRVRRNLKPGGNFPAYLAMIATNLWRDLGRSARRAGSMAEHQLASLEAPLSDDKDTGLTLADSVPDLNGMQAETQRQLMLDIDRALERLTPQFRDVLISRFLNGESCAEIGLRYGRSEQSISGWVRLAVKEIKLHLADLDSVSIRKDTHE